jgi:DNA-binding transcriptional LysR family regulator
VVFCKVVDMDSRQLSYFFAIAEEKSISKAAERLPLTSSALARQMIALEKELGVVLFERLPRGVKLTAVGEIWLQHAHKLKSMLGEAGKDIRRFAQEPAGPLPIGIIGAAMTGGAVPRILASLSANHPHVQPVLHHMSSRQQQIEALQQGQILAAFNGFFPETLDLGTEVVTQEPLWVALPSHHPLANSSAIHLTALRGHSIIGGRELKTPPPAIARVFRHHDFEPRTEHRTSDIFSFLGMTACGLGLSLLPPSLQALQFPGVVFRPLLADFELTVGLDCAYLKNQPSPLLDALLDSVRSHRSASH